MTQTPQRNNRSNFGENCQVVVELRLFAMPGQYWKTSQPLAAKNSHWLILFISMHVVTSFHLLLSSGRIAIIVSFLDGPVMSHTQGTKAFGNVFRPSWQWHESSPILILHFPRKRRNQKSITALIDAKVENHLLKDAQFDPSICDYFNPSNGLLDAVLFSAGVEDVQECDSIVKCLTSRIAGITGTAKPGPLTQAAIALVENANVDPAEIAVSPLDEPAFAYEFWFRIGFDKMNANDFCFLLNSYINYTMPWIQSEP